MMEEKGSSITTEIGGTIYSLSPARLLQFLTAQLAVSRDAAAARRPWFERDLWTSEEAILLLLDLDPFETLISDHPLLVVFSDKMRPLRTFRAVKYLDGRCIPVEAWQGLLELSLAPSDLATSIRKDVYSLDERYREMVAIWQSGDHPSRNQPAYYVAWASRKGFAVPWLEDEIGRSQDGRKSTGDGCNPVPDLQAGTNSKASLDKYIQVRAKEILTRDRTTTTNRKIATEIAGELKDGRHLGERGNYLSVETIIKAIPAGLTGGRKKNGRKSNQDE